MPKECTKVAVKSHGIIPGLRSLHLQAFDGSRLVVEFSEDVRPVQRKLEVFIRRVKQAGYALTGPQLQELMAGLKMSPDSDRCLRTISSGGSVSNLCTASADGGVRVTTRLEGDPADTTHAGRQYAACCLAPNHGIVNYHPNGYQCRLPSVVEFVQAHPEMVPEAESQWQEKRRALREAKNKAHEKDARALHLYTMECPLYRLLNEKMRGGNEDFLCSPQFRDFIDYIWHLKNAISNAERLCHCKYLYRGIRAKVDQECYVPEAIITWHAFSSTSRSLDVALEFTTKRSGEMGTLFIIYCPKGAKGIEAFSQFPEEAEWLYSCNQQFRVPQLDAQRYILEDHGSLLREPMGKHGLDLIVLEEI
eukprot:GGOE01023567.1.p1 GENE.GGOE01023567.1~~GGOE01023567.1.p1  ORF type:complete len:363 (-),score=113.49 GGOE01023567.1:846-1934(-)